MLRSINEEKLKNIYEEQVQLKRVNIHDLQIRHREFLESKLAIDLLKCAKHFISVKKISAAIVKLITSNRKVIIDAIAELQKIKNAEEIKNAKDKTESEIIAEFREPYFGSCYAKKEEVTVDAALNKMLSILNDENPDLSQVMQVHGIFAYRIYNLIEKRNEKSEFVSNLSFDSLFSKENRERKTDPNVKPTIDLGITHHPVFIKMLEKSDKKHVRAVDKCTLINHNSAFFKSAEEKILPVFCGPSTHTKSLMLGAKWYGDLAADELKEYACAAFAFLTAGGNHSFYEVMVVAKLFGVDFQSNDYSSIIPSSIKATAIYKNLIQRFPGFLNSEPLSEESHRHISSAKKI